MPRINPAIPRTPFVRRLAALAALLVLLAPPAAAAHALQGPHVLELMVRALTGAGTLRVDQEVRIDDPDIADAVLTLSETLYYDFPGRLRADALYRTSHRIHIVDGDSTLTIVDGRQTAAPAGPYDRYADLLMHRTRRTLHKLLLSSGVDVELTSLGRFEDRIVYVLGARYPDMSDAQVWVDRERFLPLRWVHVFGQGPDDRVEFIYRHWEKQNEQWYPGQIATYHRDRLIRRIDVRRLQPDIVLPADLFDRSRLMRLYPHRKAESQEPPAESLPVVDEVQRLLEEALQNGRTE